MTVSITLEKLQEMKLPHMADGLRRRLDKREEAGLAHEDFLALLVDDEYLGRQRNRLERLHKNAGFKMAATLEEVDYDASRGLKKVELLSFTQPRWLENHQCVILDGPTGVGKTFLACAIGNEACRLGYSVAYYRTQTLLQRFVEMRGTGTYLSFMAKLRKICVLILDDLGTPALSQEGTEDMMELIEARDMAGSTLVTTQLPKSGLYKAFADPTLADAICDRLFRSSIDIHLKGESRRKTSTKNTPKP
jgi:DNA replication protein DnaC